jgi:hypothetical protein
MRPSGYWTLENCKIDALNFTTRLEMCCEHMLKHKKVAI